MCSLAAALLLAGCAANRANPTVAVAAATSAASAATAAYVQSASSADVFEIVAAQLALQRSQNAAVRSFAQMLIYDHTQLYNQLEAAAQPSGAMTTAGTMLPQHSGLIAQLEAANSVEFDATYRKIEVVTHGQAWALHQRYAAMGDDAGLRDFAFGALTIAQNHRNQAHSLPIAPRGARLSKVVRKLTYAPSRQRPSGRSMTVGA